MPLGCLAAWAVALIAGWLLVVAVIWVAIDIASAMS